LIERNRVRKLVNQTIEEHNLDLSGKKVLTEVGTKNYVVTPLIAAIAGADVVWAIAKDSIYGLASEIIKDATKLAEYFHVQNKIQFIEEKKSDIIKEADIITNLGFVRPIDRITINDMSRNAVIPLMYASWEFRESDLDLEVCNQKGIPVMGTNEDSNGADVLSFCGHLCVKMIFEAGLEISKNNIIIFSRDKFGPILRDACNSLGAKTILTDNLRDENIQNNLSKADCLVISDYESREDVIGENGHISVEHLARSSQGIKIIQFTGLLDTKLLKKFGIICYPTTRLRPKRMSRTLADLGPLPVIELHTAGLKVGQVMSTAKKQGLKGKQFLLYVKKYSYGEEISGAVY
jgi:hypothetical protein